MAETLRAASHIAISLPCDCYFVLYNSEVCGPVCDTNPEDSTFQFWLFETSASSVGGVSFRVLIVDCSSCHIANFVGGYSRSDDHDVEKIYNSPVQLQNLWLGE